MQNMVKPTPTPVTRLFFTPSFKLSSSASLYLATVSQTVNTPHQGFITPGHSQSNSQHSSSGFYHTWPQSVKQSTLLIRVLSHLATVSQTVNTPHQGFITPGHSQSNSQHSSSGFYHTWPQSKPTLNSRHHSQSNSQLS